MPTDYLAFWFVNRRAEIYAYNNDLVLQRIRLANWKELHGGSKKKQQLVKKMGLEFEKVGVKLDIFSYIPTTQTFSITTCIFYTEGKTLLLRKKNTFFVCSTQTV